jgi:hypothetical protein
MQDELADITKDCPETSGSNATIMSCNASVVKIYSTSISLSLGYFENLKNLLRKNALSYYNAAAGVVNSVVHFLLRLVIISFMPGYEVSCPTHKM